MGQDTLPARNGRTIDSLQQLLHRASSDTLRLHLFNSLVNAYRNSDETDKGMQMLREAFDLEKRMLPKANEAEMLVLKKEAASTFSNLGNIYLDKFEYRSALENHLRALKIRRGLNDLEGIANSCNNIGLVYHEQSDIPNALHYYFECLGKAEQARDSSTMANVLNNIGLIHHEQGEVDKALEYQLRSLKIEEELHNSEGIASSLNNIGLLYLDKKEYKPALDHFQRSLKLMEEAGDKGGIANACNNIALVYDAQGDRERSLEFDMRSLKIEEERNNLKGVALSLSNIGYTYHDHGDQVKALEYGLLALEKCKQAQGLEQMVETEKLLSDVYAAMGKNDLALEHYKQHIVCRDSVYSEDNTRQVVKAEMNFEFSKREEMERLQQEKKEVMHSEAMKRQKLINSALAGGGGLLLLLAIVALRGYRQKRKANGLLEEKNQLIEEKNNDITSSIRYAKRIQEAILPTAEQCRRLLPDSFILYQPKDIVCGDFYWIEEKDDKVLFAAVDCTGHGVPGAFMSLVGSNLLNRSVKELQITAPARILDQVNRDLTATLRQHYEDSLVRDGMDIALCAYNRDSSVLQYAGAFNPLWLVRGGEVIEIKGNKFPVGIYMGQEMQRFTQHEIPLEKGDVIYVFSDGYYDQFGGERKKKMTRRKFRELLLSIHQKPMQEQHSILIDTFNTWKGDTEQVDDVLVMGIRIS
jgi:serine phosphatase RsbU (regulator of sigma subunit)